MIFNRGVTEAIAAKWKESNDWTRYVNAEIYKKRHCEYSNKNIQEHGENYNMVRFDDIEKFVAVEMSERDQIYGVDCLKNVSKQQQQRGTHFNELQRRSSFIDTGVDIKLE